MLKPLRLRAEDADDITILAACLQDATVKMSDIVFQPRQRRFAMLLNRFRWEDERRAVPRTLSARPHFRSVAGLHFDGVLKVRRQGIDQRNANEVLELLSILAEPGADAAAVFTLVFAGGGLIELQAECIDAQLSDLGQPVPVRRVPRHEGAGP